MGHQVNIMNVNHFVLLQLSYIFPGVQLTECTDVLGYPLFAVALGIWFVPEHEEQLKDHEVRGHCSLEQIIK
jgi:hypothetical protein